MTLLAVTLLIVYFSCNVSPETIRNAKLPVLYYKNNGDLESSITSRIVGGTPAVAGEFQGKISIQRATTYPSPVYHFCGGTLINPNHVLTAAHCVTTENGAVIDPSYFMLVGDELYLNFISSTRQARTASHVFVHPQYSVKGILNDVALIRTTSPFITTVTFSPVARIQRSPSAGTICSVAGWGSIYYEGPLSPTLLRVNATIIDRAVCNGEQSYQGYVREGMLCAGDMAGGTDACQGDSGGGLICEDQVAGIVSWGDKCAAENLPGVYTDVALYNSWIDEKIYWVGEQEDAVTPTTAANTIPSNASAAVVAFNAFVACSLMLTLFM